MPTRMICSIILLSCLQTISLFVGSKEWTRILKRRIDKFFSAINIINTSMDYYYYILVLIIFILLIVVYTTIKRNVVHTIIYIVVYTTNSKEYILLLVYTII